MAKSESGSKNPPPNRPLRRPRRPRRRKPNRSNQKPVRPAPVSRQKCGRQRAGAQQGCGHRRRASPKRRLEHEDRVKASPLARRLAEAKGMDLGELTGSGPVDESSRPMSRPAPARRRRRQRRPPRQKPRHLHGPHQACCSAGRASGDRDSARARQAVEHAQGDRAAPTEAKQTIPTSISPSIPGSMLCSSCARSSTRAWKAATSN